MLISNREDDKPCGVIDFDSMSHSFYLFEICTGISDISGDIFRKNLNGNHQSTKEIEVGAHVLAGYMRKIPFT